MVQVQLEVHRVVAEAITHQKENNTSKFKINFTLNITMTKKINPKDNQANQQNANKGKSGVNRQYAQKHGNRGAQLNPNNKNKK